jgi:hypothetical protein
MKVWHRANIDIPKAPGGTYLNSELFNCVLRGAYLNLQHMAFKGKTLIHAQTEHGYSF